jgi:hypothetical protein
MLPGPLVALALAILALPSPEPELAGARVPLIRTPSAPEAWGGPRTGAEPTLSQRVVDYELKAVLDPGTHTLEGTERVTWHNRSAIPVQSLYVHLYLNAFESEGSTFATERRRLGAFRSDVPTEEGEWGYIDLRSVRQGTREVPWTFVHPDDGPATDHTVVRFDLPEAVPPGGETVLAVSFHDQLPRVVARTGWFGSFHLVGQWYPKVGVLELPGERAAVAPRWNCHEFHLNSEFYADFGAYQLEVVVPPGVTVGASGVPSGAPTTEADGVHHRSHVEDVHDVVFTAWDGYAPPLSGSTTVPGGGEVAVEVLYPPEFEGSARVALDATLDSLRWFSQALGPYPYPRVTVVVPPYNAEEAGGMEYETFFTAEGGLDGPAGSPSLIRYVTVHEFAHGYFMGLLASNEFEEPFLDEGLNEWMDARMLEGQDLRLQLPPFARWLGVALPDLTSWTSGLFTGSSRYPADAVAATSWDRWSVRSYGQVYTRTELAMHDLTQLLGPELTARALQTYYRRWHHRHPSAADFREAFVEAGADRALVERWFDEQIYAATPIDDRVERLATEDALPELGSREADGGRSVLEEEDRDEQVAAARKAFKAEHGEAKPDAPGPFPCRSTVAVRRYGAHVPRSVELSYEDGSTETLEWPLADPWKRWELVRPVCVASARLDTLGTMYLDLNRLDDARTRKPAVKAAVGVATAAFGWLELALALVEAL